MCYDSQENKTECGDRKEAHRNTPGLSSVSVPSVSDRPAEQQVNLLRNTNYICDLDLL